MFFVFKMLLLHYQSIFIDKYTNIMLSSTKKTQLNVKVPASVKWELEEVVFARKRRGEKASIGDVLIEYIESGIKTEKEKHPEKYSFID